MIFWNIRLSYVLFFLNVSVCLSVTFFISKLRSKGHEKLYNFGLSIKEWSKKTGANCTWLTSEEQSHALRSDRCMCWDPPLCCLVFWEQTGLLNSVIRHLVQVPPEGMMEKSHPLSHLLIIQATGKQKHVILKQVSQSSSHCLSMIQRI